MKRSKTPGKTPDSEYGSHLASELLSSVLANPGRQNQLLVRLEESTLQGPGAGTLSSRRLLARILATSSTESSAQGQQTTARGFDSWMQSLVDTEKLSPSTEVLSAEEQLEQSLTVTLSTLGSLARIPGDQGQIRGLLRTAKSTW